MTMTEFTPADYVATHRVGAATVSAISDATGQSTILKMLVGVPPEVWRREAEADENGDVRLGYNVAHVRIGDASILIDLGFDDPSPSSHWHAPRHLRTPGTPAGLTSLGVEPGDVTHVLITHAHGDHIAGGSVERDSERVPRYPNARHYLNRRDWEDNSEREQAGSHAATHLATIDRFGLLELVDGEREIVPGVTMISAPGETPGHAIVRVESRGEVFYFLGDLFHHPCEVAHLDWVAEGRDAAAMRASRDKLVADALASDALLLPTHMLFPGFGRLERTADGVRWHAVR
jgi:glyoxylase-like metal-dependent hydrolase (beta-lactamase superfamily II)